MNMEKLKKIIKENGLEEKIRNMSFALDESDQNSYGLELTIWKNGNVTVSLVQRGCFYDDETEKYIKETIYLPRFVIYDNYDIDAALDNGIPEDEIQDYAIDTYKQNFDLDEYLKFVDFDEWIKWKWGLNMKIFDFIYDHYIDLFIIIFFPFLFLIYSDFTNLNPIIVAVVLSLYVIISFLYLYILNKKLK